MRVIQLNGGHETIVDDADYEHLKAFGWWAKAEGDSAYVYAAIDGKLVALHRYLLDAPTGREVDHKNRNPLDNRRENIRLCTRRENALNRHNRAKHPGVYFKKSTSRWRARLKSGGKTVYEKYFRTEAEAIAAYSAAVAKFITLQVS